MLKKYFGSKVIRSSFLSAFVLIQPSPETNLPLNNKLDHKAQYKQDKRSIAKSNFTFEKIIDLQLEEGSIKGKRKGEEKAEEILDFMFPVGTPIKEIRNYFEKTRQHPVATENTRLFKNRLKKHFKKEFPYASNASLNKIISRYKHKSSCDKILHEIFVCYYDHPMSLFMANKLDERQQKLGQNKTHVGEREFQFFHRWVVLVRFKNNKIKDIEVRMTEIST